MVIPLRYGNTNTFLIKGGKGSVLVDTDYAGTMPAFYKTIDEKVALILRFEESRSFFEGLGIEGEIIATPSHSEDSISVILDEGICLVGDLEPYEYLEADRMVSKYW